MSDYTKKYYIENREERIRRSREYSKRNRDRINKRCREYRGTEWGRAMTRGAKFKHKYGITFEQHEQMHIDQKGRCKICEKVVIYNKIHTDHDHKTGKVRGLLCCRCNHLLAGFDDAEFYGRAIEYLRCNAGVTPETETINLLTC